MIISVLDKHGQINSTRGGYHIYEQIKINPNKVTACAGESVLGV